MAHHPSKNLFKNSPRKRVHLFINHVKKFMGEAKLFPPSGRGFIAVSGGMDSVALLACLSELKGQGLFRELIVLHVNHGTRPDQNEREAELVRTLSQQFGCGLLEKTLTYWSDKANHKADQTKKSNFEFQARDGRCQFFRQEANPEDRVYTAHHIDDSFEWSLLQQVRSSSTLPTLGIPVLNGVVARPFHCVTRQQIANFVSDQKINYWDDPTNKDCHFDRNFIRHQVIHPLRQRFPALLKHYVYRSNDLARRWGKSAFQDNNNLTDYLAFRDSLNSHGFFSLKGEKDFTPLEEEICSLIHRASSQKRGVLRFQVKKFLQAARRGKWGPLLFSGGVKGFMLSGIFIILSSESEEKYLRLDEQVAKKLAAANLSHSLSSSFSSSFSNLTFEEFSRSFQQKLLSLPKSNHNANHNTEQDWRAAFPFWVISPDNKQMKSLLPSLKKPHPLWPQTTSYFIENEIWFRSASEVLINWKKLKELKGKNYLFNVGF